MPRLGQTLTLWNTSFVSAKLQLIICLPGNRHRAAMQPIRNNETSLKFTSEEIGTIEFSVIELNI